MNKEKHILTMLVENEPGVTARITGLFAGRGYNIETICGAPTADPEISRITITTRAGSLQLEQCMKQIRRLTNVIKLRDMTGREAVKRELAIICVCAGPESQTEIESIVDSFNGKIIDKGYELYTIEVTGKENSIDELLLLLEPFGIKKLARSGILALYREE
ncbi:MAG: acetolactate synthase small subunit [Thermodesulfobacteriota bacterium]|nr:acetolactate synthase small subunit [Thermodesulfobacteriota bacterium]